jgi:drug/metabolite transporter (DMT)-like permease
VESKKARRLAVVDPILGLLSIGVFCLPSIAASLSTMDAARQGLPRPATQTPSPYFACCLIVGVALLFAAFISWCKA